ncbi:hypothetical protein A1OO_20475 [Enterovibrio norvegicus FF-33]|nr:hypothetical protein A1OO_20475 [Enterovibrio norvegicus FF-33]
MRNGAEVEYFSKRPNTINLLNKNRPIVGYYGAIAEWFDVQLLIRCAKAYEDWDFIMIGNVTCDVSEAKKLGNVRFLGEIPYDKLTGFLADFDICLIPFKLIELTLCTNPVKVYEYLAAGKPVVCTAMPEVKIIDDMVHVAESYKDFIKLMQVAMDESKDSALLKSRKEWAMGHDWSNRAQEIHKQIKLLNKKHPKVSLIVLTYNNLELTKECLESIRRNTKYNNYEVIIVDNMSTDGTREYLSRNYHGVDNYKIILNDQNLGFSGGNNVGLRRATGEILVLLNNDTYVSPFWLGALVNTFNKNSDLGLIGPVTNNIGNESKINLAYSDWSDMNVKVIDYYSRNIGKLYPLECAAFFCVAITRNVFESVGDMSQEYGLGFFEDDDYCIRVKNCGWKIAAVEQSFVHHHLSASFNKLKDNKKQELMDRNKAIFESKWGEWKPHKYRSGVK